MNKKGFTLIELITTFALTSVIIIILINIVIVIKNIYTKNDVKSELLIEQSNLSNLINKKFDVDFLNSYTQCNDSEFCYTFYFVDGTSSKLVVTDNYIKFDSYVYKFKKGTTSQNPTLQLLDTEALSGSLANGFLVIKIPIKNKLYPNEDFGINIVYQYNFNQIGL
jgi:hypothetical protein